MSRRNQIGNLHPPYLVFWSLLIVQEVSRCIVGYAMCMNRRMVAAVAVCQYASQMFLSCVLSFTYIHMCQLCVLHNNICV